MTQHLNLVIPTHGEALTGPMPDYFVYRQIAFRREFKAWVPSTLRVVAE